MANSLVRDAEPAATPAIILHNRKRTSSTSLKHWRRSTRGYVSRRLPESHGRESPFTLTGAADWFPVQAETALAAQQNRPAQPRPLLTADAFEPDSLASWFQLPGIPQPSGEPNMGSASNNGQVAAPPMAIPPGLDFDDPATYTLPPVPPFQQPTEPSPPTYTAIPTLSNASITSFGNNTSSNGWTDLSRGASQSSMSQTSGPTSRDWSSSDISSRITTPGTSVAQSEALETLPPNVGNDLLCSLLVSGSQRVMADTWHRFQTYSQTVHHYFPMIDGQRFQSRVDETPVGSEFVALRYAIWAHAAVFLPQYLYLSDRFYLQARMQIEVTEARSPHRFFTIPALQTLILIALYELQHTCFIRSWVSVSRATWLAHSLGLHRMDKRNSKSANNHSLNLLPYTDDLMALEERRRTFWVVLQLNCFSNVGICWNSGMGFDHAEISTYLPADDLDEQNSGSQMTLGVALKSSVTGILCPLQGAALVASLCLQCVSHVTQVNKEYSFQSPTYDFWTHHHHLKELIDHASYTALVHLKPNQCLTDPNVLSLNMTLQATIICLHHAVISRVSRVEKNKAHGSVVAESDQRCIEAALEFVSTVRYTSQVNTTKLNPSIPWTFYVVLQYLVRKAQADASPKPPSRSEMQSSATPYGSPVISPTARYRPRKPSMNTSDRFGAFQTGPGEGFISSSNQTTPKKRAASFAILDYARVLDSMHFLRSRLNALTATIPLAKVFEIQINEEIESGEAGTRERLVGLARFLPVTEGVYDQSDSDVNNE
ncbi:MAG: hypothetical protein Q9196_001130 [Gyalolechia fulgens]